MSDERKISRERYAEFLRAVCEYLEECGGSATRPEIFRTLQPRLALSEYELSKNNSGYERWRQAIVFAFIGFQKAGYLKRGGGTWRLLDAGRVAQEEGAAAIGLRFCRRSIRHARPIRCTRSPTLGCRHRHECQSMESIPNGRNGLHWI